MLVHLLGVEVRDEERDVVPLDGLAPEHDEALGAHHHEPHELLAEDAFDVVSLLDEDGHADRVDGRLDEDALGRRPGDDGWS